MGPASPAATFEAVPAARRNMLVSPGVRVEAPVFRFDDLAPEQTIAGPAIVEYRGSTLFLPTGWSARIDIRRNAHLARAAITKEQAAPGAIRKEVA